MGVCVSASKSCGYESEDGDLPGTVRAIEWALDGRLCEYMLCLSTTSSICFCRFSISCMALATRSFIASTPEAVLDLRRPFLGLGAAICGSLVGLAGGLSR
jgi:hypothetical protein